MQKMARGRGFSLIDLMIVVGIIGIIAASAFPMYKDYVTAARVANMTDGIQSIRLFQEDRRLREGEYVEGTYDPANPDVAGGLKDLTVLDWDPRASVDDITYVVTCTTDATSPECTRTSGFTVTATHAQVDDPVVITF